MRLFVDTDETWNGGALVAGQYDKQRAKITVMIEPDNTPLDQLAIRWELTDPDDPATHSDIDANTKGGDNNGTPHEREGQNGHWFTTADHNIDNRVPAVAQIDVSAVDETTVIGTATTVVTAGVNNVRTSSIFINYSDHGGDNLLVRPVLVHVKSVQTTPATYQQVDKFNTEVSGLLTVWRKRWMVLYAMAGDATIGVLDALPSGTGRFNNFISAFASNDPNKNCYIDFACADATGPGRIGSVQETFPVQQGDVLRVVQNETTHDVTMTDVTSGYATAAEVLARMTANGVGNVSRVDDNRRILIDYTTSISVADVSSNPVASLFNSEYSPTGTLTAFRTLNTMSYSDVSRYAQWHTRYHTNANWEHPAATVQVIGGNPVIVDELGTTASPHSMVHVALIQSSLLRITSAVYPAEGWPIQAGSTLTITSNKGTRTVTFTGAEFDGTAPRTAVLVAINTAGGNAGVTAYAGSSGAIYLQGDDSDLAWMEIANSGVTGNLGFTTARATRVGHCEATTIHEAGHSLMQPGDAAFHDNHSSGYRCTGERTGGGQWRDWCPKHVKELRKNVGRVYNVNHTYVAD